MSKNDYKDIEFLIIKYPTEMLQLSSRIDKAHRMAFFNEFASLNASNKPLVDRVRQSLGLEEKNNANSDWVWYTSHKWYRRWVDGAWQWALQ